MIDNYLLLFSISGVFVYLCIAAWRPPRRAAGISAVLLVGFTLVLWRAKLLVLPWESVPTAKGSGEYLLLALYISMVLGMVAQYFYARFERPRNRRPKFDWGTLLLPILTSPIVFIPLAATFSRLEPDNAPKLMLLLVAFENGFFWRHFLAHRKESRT